WATFARSERSTDWNGDGDTNDRVAFVYDHATHVATSTGFALASTLTFPFGSGHLVVVEEGEPDQGNRDQNGDGDAADVVPIGYERATGVGRSLGVALNLPPSVDVRGDFVVVGVNERLNGHGDLDGDGDTSDRFVVYVYDATTGAVTNLRSPDPGLGVPHAG